MMEYDLETMYSEIETIEERTRRLKELAQGIEAIERNADAILNFVYILKRSVSDLIK